MSINDLKARLPDYAKDLRLNLESVLSEGGAPGLKDSQIRMVALATAVAARYAPLTAAVDAWAAELLNEQQRNGARAAAAMMAMSNIYYRFTHMAGDPEYATLRAGLRMNVMANPGIDKIDFEMCSLAVSAINGCAACVESHEKTLRKHEVPIQAVQSAARIAAVMHAVAVTLEQLPAADSLAQAA